MSAVWKTGMCGVTFSPNVNVALWWAERERQRSETESQCVRKSQRKRCLRVSRRTREKVRKKMTERERVKERERRREREAACVRALSWLTAGCYSSWHAAPSSPHTSGVRLAGKRSGRAGGGGLGEKEVVVVVWRVLQQRQNIPLSKRRICAFNPTPHPHPGPPNPVSSCSLTSALSLSASVAACLQYICMI